MIQQRVYYIQTPSPQILGFRNTWKREGVWNCMVKNVQVEHSPEQSTPLHQSLKMSIKFKAFPRRNMGKKKRGKPWNQYKPNQPKNPWANHSPQLIRVTQSERKVVWNCRIRSQYRGNWVRHQAQKPWQHLLLQESIPSVHHLMMLCLHMRGQANSNRPQHLCNLPSYQLKTEFWAMGLFFFIPVGTEVT